MNTCHPLYRFRWLFCWVILAISGTALASAESEQAPLRRNAAIELETASAAIDEAARKKALWIPAVEAIEDARAAFDEGDFEHAIELARTAKKLAQLGIRQLDYPPYRQF
jgi:hypothetical protein